MIKYSRDFDDAIRSLRAVLARCYYDEFLRNLGDAIYFLHPTTWLGPPPFPRKYARLEEPYRSLVGLLTFGEEVEATQIAGILPQGLQRDLTALGLLEYADGRLRTARYTLISLLDHYFFVNRPGQHSRQIDLHVYLGNDSYYLLYGLPSRGGGRALDVGCGSGILGIFAARNHGRVVGTEISPEAVEVARVNVVLNGLEGKVEILAGDVYGPLAPESFDLIVSNPPYVALPGDLAFPTYGMGGEDGLAVFLEILKGFPERSTPEGLGVFFVESPGGGEGPVLLPEMNRFLADHKGLRCTVFVTERLFLSYSYATSVAISMHCYTDGALGSVEDLAKAMRTFYRDRGYRYMYRNLIYLEKVPGTASQLSTHRFYNRWSPDKTPVLKKDITLTPQEHYFIGVRGGLSHYVDDIHRDFLLSLDGKSTLREVAGRYYEQNRKKYEAFGEDEVLNKLLSLCNFLEEHDIVDPPS
jgi:SAM-dependent methyltransferase